MSVIATIWLCLEHVVSTPFAQSAQPITVQSGFRSFWLFSIACTNSGDRIIHRATRMNLGVTLPQAFHQPPSSCRVPKNFLSMQLGSEILRQLTASFSCCFFGAFPLFLCSLQILESPCSSPNPLFFASPNLYVCLCPTMLQKDFFFHLYFKSLLLCNY